MTSNYRDAYWTLAQLVAHHTINGCNLRAGDLFGSGTLSGPEPSQAGSLLELTRGGTQPIRLSNGETRGYLEDGDTVILRGRCRARRVSRRSASESAGAPCCLRARAADLRGASLYENEKAARAASHVTRS